MYICVVLVRSYGKRQFNSLYNGVVSQSLIPWLVVEHYASVKHIKLNCV